MGTATIEYRGYTIRYGENDEKWWCNDIEFSHEKASKVKERIDDLHRKLRKASALQCLIVSGEYSDRLEVIEGTIVEYLGPQMGRSHAFSSKLDKLEGHKVAVMAVRRAKEKMSRSTALIETLVPLDDPSVWVAVDKVKEIEAKIAALSQERRAIIKTIPRLTIDAIPDLIKASEHRFTEGEKTP